MERTPVSSSGIKSIGHDGSRLHVEFSSGAVHEYDGVTPEAHAELMAADSIGSHFSKHIRPKFTSKRLEVQAGE